MKCIVYRNCINVLQLWRIKMKHYELIAPCHFGLEAVLKKEINDLGYDIIKVEDGRVTFLGDADAICRCNIFLRTAERIMIKVGAFHAVTFEEMFEGTKALEWEEFIPVDGKFWVTKATSVKSKLFSTTDIQRIVKKAIVENMKEVYHQEWFDESGSEFPMRVFVFKDEVTIALDTSGEALHRRGYRQNTTKAPISETLAAALIMLTPWNKDRILVDPFCGSGTIPIEAAMMALNMAPGMGRNFKAEEWRHLIPKKLWYENVEEANDIILRDEKLDIQGYDINPRAISQARDNAKLAGVEQSIHLQTRAMKDFSHPKHYGFIITNPPYGERLEEKENLPVLYREIGEKYKALNDWSAFIITSYREAEQQMGLKATKNRKIYNGMLKTYYYQFMGPKPPRIRKEDK